MGHILKTCEQELTPQAIGVLIEDGAMIGSIYQTHPLLWRWDLFADPGSLVATATGQAITLALAKVELVGAAIDFLIDTEFGPDGSDPTEPPPVVA